MLYVANTLALAVGWLVLAGLLTAFVLVGLEGRASKGVFNLTVWGFGVGLIDRRVRGNEQLYQNLRVCGYRLCARGNFVFGYS